MEQLPALSTVLCILLFIFTWGTAVAEFPAGCKRVGILNPGTSIQRPDGLKVSQEPRSLNAPVGESVTLSCTFQIRNGSTARALWLRGSEGEVEVDSHHPFYRGRLSLSSLDELRQGKATLTLTELEERDAGIYRCCIDIYNAETGMGGGTELRVMHRQRSATGNKTESQSETSPELTIYRAVIALAGVGIILLAGALVLCRHKAPATETQQKEPPKRDERSASNPGEGLHYAKINVKTPTHTEYACVRTKRL